jgi:general secretion pathway protein K
MKARQEGAALLLAMLILALVATLAAGMVWQQSRAVNIEAAERARSQAAWILLAGLDFSRLILREDRRTSEVDDLTEPWSREVGEARLSTLLAADRDNNADSGPEAFLSGRIVDAQARYNLRNLFSDDGKTPPAEQRALEHLCDAAGLPSDTPSRLIGGLRSAWAGTGDAGQGGAPLAPQRTDQLIWLGLEPDLVGRLEPFVTILPQRTPVNVNTASREVLLAAVDGLDLATAERLVQTRQRRPFATVEQIKEQLPEGLKVEAARADVKSGYFEVFGRLRLEDRVIEEHSLVERRGPDRGLTVVPLQRDRRALQGGTP